MNDTTNNQVIWIRIKNNDLALCERYARDAEQGGVSRIRPREERMDMLGQDQLLGQLGCCALSLYQTGSTHAYNLSRWFANLNPSRGDGGSDLPGSNIDIKTSALRDDWSTNSLLDMTLLVRPKERHDKTVYILAVAVHPAHPENRNDCWWVALVGWARDTDLSNLPSEDARFNGAFALPARDLKALMPIRWFANQQNRLPK